MSGATGAPAPVSANPVEPEDLLEEIPKLVVGNGGSTMTHLT